MQADNGPLTVRRIGLLFPVPRQVRLCKNQAGILYSMSNTVANTTSKAPVEDRGVTRNGLTLRKVVRPVFVFVGECGVLVGQSLKALARREVMLSDIIAQMAQLGVDSMGIVLLISIATGAVFAFYISNISNLVGYSGFVGSGVTYAFLNELGPVLGGVAFASRVGSAIAAELGTMVVTEQVDALRAMAVSPVRYLVAPRLAATVLMLPVLVVFGDIAGIVIGYYVSGLSGVPHAGYVNSIRVYIHAADLTNGLIKAVWFGLIVGVTSCRQGLRAERGAAGVGRATISSVVLCVVLIFVSDFFLTLLLTNTAGTH